MKKKIAVLGSTGSIGRSTLNVVRSCPDKMQVAALAACSNITLLQEQIHEFHPEIVAVYDEEKARCLKKIFPNLKIVSRMEGLCEVACFASVTYVVCAMTGSVGIRPTAAAIKAGKTIGLANKEVLVSAGSYIMQLAKEHQVDIIPIDSEHSAIFQCLQGNSLKSVRRLILTASGGPFLNTPDEELNSITLDKALNHPTWQMGSKITIDSSTLMNKGFEVIEAHFLFDMPLDKIEVVIHPQSIIHSFVEYIDGSCLAQMSEPTMMIPIQYALTYPERQPSLMKPFDFTKAFSLQFFPPDVRKFRCLALAFEALTRGGSAPCYLNAANEELVKRFCQKEIGWHEIGEKLEKLLLNHKVEHVSDVELLLEIDEEARKEARGE